VLHAPQWAGSPAVSTQAPPQLVWPPGQDARHTAASQASPSPQKRSHEPQWTRSLVRSKQASPQRVCPSGQLSGGTPLSSTPTPPASGSAEGTSASSEGTMVLPAQPTKAPRRRGAKHRYQ
jgi:hypothetical protein